MDKDLSSLFSEIKKDILSFLDFKLKILQLDLCEKTGRISSLLLYGLILLFVFFFAVLFIFLAFGLFLGEVLHSNAIGFTLIAVLYIIAFVIIFAFRRNIQNFLTNLFISEMIKEDGENEQ